MSYINGNSEDKNKARTDELVEDMFNITKDCVDRETSDNYVKILLLIEMYKTYDEVMSDNILKELFVQDNMNIHSTVTHIITSLESKDDDVGIFYTLSRFGRQSRQTIDSLFGLLQEKELKNDEELFYANPDTSYINDGSTNKMRRKHKAILDVYLNMLTATIIKQRLLIADLSGREMRPIRLKSDLLPEIERSMQELTAA